MRYAVRRLIPLLLYCFCALPLVFSQSIEITSVSDAPREVDPGSVLTTAFLVSNRRTLREEYSSLLILPPRWRLVAIDAYPVIPFESGETIFATVYVPADAVPGLHELTFAIRDRYTEEAMAALAFNVVVRSKPGFSLQLVDAPDYVVAGEVYQSLYRIQNTGNAALNLNIAVRSNPDLDHVSEVSALELAPGAARVFAVSVRTDQSYHKRINHILRVNVSGSPGIGPKSVASSVEILPRISGEDKPFRTLPVNLAVVQKLRHAETDTYGFLARIKAEGALSETGDDAFSAFAKIPFDKDGALFNEESEFSVAYRKDRFDLFLGNAFFAVSTLTESSIYGTGARIEYRGDNFTLGGYHMETGFSPPAVSQRALWYGLELGDTTDIRLNLVDSVKTGESGGIELLTGVEIKKAGGTGPNTVFEFASDAFHGNSKAYYLALNDSRKDYSYTVEAIRADPGFSGEKEDVEQYGARISIPLRKDFAVTSDIRARYSSLDQDIRSLAETVSLGVKLNLTPETAFGVSYVRVEDAGRYAQRSHLTEGIGATLNHRKERIHISANGHVSTTFNQPAADTLLKESYSGSVKYDIDATQMLRGFTTVSTARGVDSTHSLTFGIDYTAKIKDNTSLQLAYRSSSKTGSYYAGQDSLRASLVHRMAQGQTVMLQGTYAPKRSLDRFTDFTLSLEYHASVGIPIGLRRVGKVAGVLIDAVTGRGVPDVIVRIGDRVAISDLSGRFLFLSMSPGPYTVGVDVSRLKENRILADPSPIKVEVKSGETSSIEVLLVEPGVVSGTVRRFSRSPEGELTDMGGYPDLLVEVIGARRRLRVVTDRNGYFRVTGLTPGEWVVTIASSQLSDDTYIETDKPYINLARGGSEEVFLGVYPVRREIRMIDEGTIFSGGNREVESEEASSEE